MRDEARYDKAELDGVALEGVNLHRPGYDRLGMLYCRTGFDKSKIVTN